MIVELKLRHKLCGGSYDLEMRQHIVSPLGFHGEAGKQQSLLDIGLKQFPV